MKIFVVGLGMMGSSYAKKLTTLGYEVYGYDTDDSTTTIALEKGFIKSADINHLKNSDYIILCLYPKDNVLFLKHYKSYINKTAFVTDISGVKTNMIDQIKDLIDNPYMSHHPMAGSEIKGIKGVNPNIFKGANFLIIDDENTKEELDQLLFLKEALEFGKATITTKQMHDQMISFTSQLPHALAIALVNSDTYPNTSAFSGDSFRDLTRIASINASLWSELLLDNKNHLLKDLKHFKEELNKVIHAIEENDASVLNDLMKQAKEKRDSY